MNTLDQNTKFDAWDALRQDRDGWRQRAMDQADYIQYLEQQLSTLQQQLQMKEQQDNQKIVNQFYGPYIKENHVEPGANQILSAENVYLPGAEKVSIDSAESSTAPSQSVSAESILGIPAERDYKAVRIYIEERSRFDQEFKTFCSNHSRVAICQRLSEEFGWLVDPYGLGRNINRERKKK